MNYYYFVPIVAFLGLIAGVILKKIAKEEVISGKRYLKWTKKSLLFLLLLSLLYYAQSNYLILFCGILIGFLLAIFAEDYIFIGLSLAISFYFPKSLLFLIAVLVFLYGLPYGSLYSKKKEMYFIFKNALYFSLAFLILYFHSYLIINPAAVKLIVGICSGSIFHLFIRRQ